jgi:hypothetical protein
MRWRTFGLIFSVIISLITAAPISPESDESDDDPSRLPKTSFPIHYDITLWTAKDFVMSGELNFDGNVKIQLEISKDTNEIVLHNKNIDIKGKEAKMWRDDVEFEIETIETTGLYDFMTIRTKNQMKVGEKFTLELPYSADLQLGMSGFYRSSYRVGNERR